MIHHSLVFFLEIDKNKMFLLFSLYFYHGLLNLIWSALWSHVTWKERFFHVCILLWAWTRANTGSVKTLLRCKYRMLSRDVTTKVAVKWGFITSDNNTLRFHSDFSLLLSQKFTPCCQRRCRSILCGTITKIIQGHWRFFENGFVNR